MKELIKWLENKGISFKSKNKIIEIEGFGKLLYIEGDSGNLIDDGYAFVLSQEEYDIIEDEDSDVKHLVFKWGTKFYYSELVSKRGEDNEDIYEPRFNDLNNIGKYESEFKDLGFVNLGVHTGYELLNGSGEPETWVKKAKFLQHDCIGICEKNTLAGTLPLQIACKKKELKCVLGQTITIAIGYDPDKEYQDTFELKLYVINKKGWINLLNISKMINVDFNQYIPEEVVFEKSEGLIVVFPTDSYLNKLLDDKKKCLKYISKYKKYFGKNLFYQIDSTEFDDDSLDIQILKNYKNVIDNYSNLLNPVLISDAYYVEKDDFLVKDFLNKIDRKALPFSKEQYYKDIDDILNKFLNLFEKNTDKFDFILKAAENTRVIADRCNYQIDTGNHKLPKFEVDNPEQLYDEQILLGFEKKVIEKFQGDEDKIQQYIDRVQEENDVIKGAGFIDYFLILWDVVSWAKGNDILVGPGRGSVGGSLVAYLLGITEIDPIQYNLLFERFLNKARVSGERAKAADSLPDIDIDFEGKRRHEVKRYIEEKYGNFHVCSVGTYSRLKPKSAIKDFARVKGVSFNDVNFATREIPDSHHPDWGDIFRHSIEKGVLKEFVQKNVDICETIKAPLGQPRSGSIHPSAVLIVPKHDSEGNPMQIFDWMPVKMMDGQLVSEWEGKYIDSAGFLKEDILGIQQLDKFKYILNSIKELQNKKINLNKIPIDKKDVMSYFKKGLNEDVFQFGTSGLKTYSKKVKPDGIEDLISMNALFRPGPMDSGAHEDFAKIKHGEKKPMFDDFMEEVTKNTFGLYVYQEQIMQAMVVGGLTLVEADQVRTYMKKFDEKSLSTFKEKFIKGYSKLFKSKNSKELAIKVWDKLYAFSGYGFNRSHSAAYALMGYWCQYLKVRYPLEFWTASLNFADEKVEVPQRLSEIAKVSDVISVKHPDINKSNTNFTANKENNAIYWSLTKIKGVGDIAASKIIEVRDQGGDFFSLEDFVNRVPKAKVNKRVVQSLIIAGAFDEIGGEDNLEISSVKERLSIMIQHSKLVKCDIPDWIDVNKNSDHVWSIRQRDLTGYGFIDFLPLIKKKVTNLNKFPYYTSKDLDDGNFKDGFSWTPEKTGTPMTVAGRVMSIKEKRTKGGHWMVNIMFESNNMFSHIGIFGETWDKMRKQFEEILSSKELCCVNGYALENKPYGEQKRKSDTKNNKLWLNSESKLVNLSK